MEELLIILFILLGPLLDVSSFYNLPINIVLRSIYLISIIFLMLKRKKNIKYLSILFIFALTQFLYQHISLDYSIKSNISSILKFMYLPCSILYFKDFEFKKYNKKKILGIVILTYIGIYLFSYITNIGSNVYLEEEGKKGFKGLFSSINEFSAILVCLLPIVTNYLRKNKKYILIVLLLVLTSICALLIGTKILLGGILFTIMYLLFKERDYLFFKRSKNIKITIMISLIVVLLLGGFLFTKTRTYQNMKVQQKFFKVNNVLSYEYINKVIYNDRLSFLSENYDYYKNQNTTSKLLGIGINNDDIKMVEIDIFDIIFRYGIISILVFIYPFIIIKYKKLEQEEIISLILILFISLLSGHVLIYPNVCIYIGIILSKNKVSDVIK